MNKYDESNIELFENEENYYYIERYNFLLELLREFIEIVDEMVIDKKCDNTDCFEGVCYLFAKSIIKYAKASMDNLMLGHFEVSSIINRTLLENYVCFELIFKNKEEALWKYWLVYSYYHVHDQFSKRNKEMLDKFMKRMINRQNIEIEFSEKYIDKPYGWTFKINKNFNFKGLCKLVESSDYKDFKYESEYVHGVSLFQKEAPFGTEGAVLNVISLLFIYVQFFAETYCLEQLCLEYFDIREQFYEYNDVILNSLCY